MKLEFIEQGPALLVSNTKTVLVIADLHLGIESDLARHGIYFRSRSRQRQEKALRCIRDTSPDITLLLGDVKHGIPLTTRQEYRELPEMLSLFRKYGQLMVTPGNHDIGIERFLLPEELLPKNGVLIDGTGYLHGHTRPDPVLTGHLMIAGHHHPFVFLRDDVGCSLRAPAYLFARLRDECFNSDRQTDEQRLSEVIPDVLGVSNTEVGTGPGNAIPGRKIRSFLKRPRQIVGGRKPPASELHREGPGEGTTGNSRVLFVPAFNELSGFDIQRIAASPISPLSRCMDIGSCEIYLTDGTYIGPLSSVEDN